MTAACDCVRSRVSRIQCTAGFSRGLCEGTRPGGNLYIGITKNWAARSAWHWAARGRTIVPIASGLTYQEARGAEQLLIDYHGLGSLDNLINSISFSNPNFQNYVTQGLYALQAQGAAPF